MNNRQLTLFLLLHLGWVFPLPVSFIQLPSKVLSGTRRCDYLFVYIIDDTDDSNDIHRKGELCSLDQQRDGQGRSHQVTFHVAQDDLDQNIPAVQSRLLCQRDRRVPPPQPFQEARKEASQGKRKYECCNLLWHQPPFGAKGSPCLHLFLFIDFDCFFFFFFFNQKGALVLPFHWLWHDIQVWWNLERFSNVIVKVPEGTRTAIISIQDPIWKRPVSSKDTHDGEKQDNGVS